MFDHSCTLCPLGATAKTCCVPGTGPTKHPQYIVDAANVAGQSGYTEEAEAILLQSDVMLVGQNPGQTEDAYGAPFIGPAGQKLDELLLRAGWHRDRCYITNAVKCVTPSDRTPRAKEMRACMGYLKHEIEAVNPKVIVALGATAFETLTGQGGLTKVLGSRQELRDELRTNGPVLVIPTYHPSAVLHARSAAPSMEQQIVDNLKTAVRSLDGSFTQIPVEWAWITDTLDTPPGGDLSGTVISFDIETNKKPTWHPDFRIRMLSIDAGIKTCAVFRGQPILGGLAWLDACRKAGATLVGHNASGFDREGIFSRTGLNLMCEDTMLLAQAVDEEGPKELELCCTRYLGVAPWKDEVTWDWSDGPQTDEEWERAGLYAARDAVYTRYLYFALAERAMDDQANLRYYREITLPSSRALARLERNGLYLSRSNIQLALGELRLQQLTALANARNILQAPKFNPGSSQQVNKVVFKTWQLPASTFTDGGVESTGEFAIKWTRRFAQSDEQRALIDAVLSYRKAGKMVGTYIEKWLHKLAGVSDDRLHPSYSLINSPSRTSSFEDDEYGFNAQNVPRDPRMRRCIAAPPGYKLVSADLSMNELRVGAWIAPEPSMLAALRSGADLHLMLAQRIAAMSGRDPAGVTKKERDDAKPVQFGSMYLATGYTLMVQLLKDYDISITEEEGDARIAAWHNQWPGFHQSYYPRIKDEVFSTGMVRCPDGSVRHFPTATRALETKERTEILRAAVNYPIQKFATTLALVGLILLVGYCGYDARRRVCQFGHDSYLLEVESGIAEHVAAEIKPLVETGVPAILQEKIGVNFDVPIKLDVKVLEAWV